MPNLNDTRADIEGAISTLITPILPVSYDNVPFDSDAIAEYVHSSISFLDANNVNIGAVNQKRIRYEGDIVFKLYVQIGAGTSSAFQYLDSIKIQLENKYISNNLLTYAAEPIRKGVGKEGYYTYFLRIPFVSDEC